MRHEIKCWPQYYSRVIEGSKTFEVRENDRGYQPGDEVIMREWDKSLVRHDGYTGRRCIFRIGYVFPLDEKRVVFSILDLIDGGEK